MKALGRFRRIAHRFVERDRPIILMYHRITRVIQDPWQLAVWPDRFAEQIEALAQVRDVVPLGWLAAELAQDRIPKRVAAVTFDDGYADVLTHAKPILERYGCPATVFLVTGAIGSPYRFWWDELSRIFLETPSLPSELEVEIAGNLYRWLSDGELAGSREDAGKPYAVSREQLHLELWRLLRPLEPEPRWRLLVRLCRWAGVEIEQNSADRPLTTEEVGRLAAPGFVDIGAHSVTHPALSLLDEVNLKSEIESSRAACEDLIREPVRAFAYPYGDFSDGSVTCVRDAGFTCACTTNAGRVSSQSDPLRLPRIAIANWSGDDFAQKIARPTLVSELTRAAARVRLGNSFQEPGKSQLTVEHELTRIR